jgi:hypothetical protein
VNSVPHAEHLSCRFVIVSVRFVMIEPGNLPPF